MIKKRLVSGALSVVLAISLIFAAPTVLASEDLKFSQEYKTSPYYTKLTETLENTKDKSAMERTLAVALSQEGYKNYATAGIDVEQARADGLLWTGKELRMNANLTGNTEYTRWAERYIMDHDEAASLYDMDWCAIFVSWCLYQAGYNDDERLKRYYYAYCAEPRIEFDADSWILAYNFRQQGVYYTPKAHHKLDKYNWNTYYHIDVDPFDIPYQPGGLIFFSWDSSGAFFDHVAIVVDYDQDTHVLTYTNGNSDGMVITRQIDLDVEEEFRGNQLAKNSDRVMAYVEYDNILPLEPKDITTTTPVVEWQRNGSEGLKIQTNSDSVIGSVTVDEEYLGSNVESNMVLHEGLLSIGKSELVKYNLGKHDMMLTFDDGAVPVVVNIYDNYRIGDANIDGAVTIGDVTKIQRILAGLEEDEGGIVSRRCNVDGNKLSVTDATEIQRYLARYPNVFNIEETAKDYGKVKENYELPFIPN